MESQQQTLLLNRQQGILNLYDRYAGMLLGYINEIVKDRELAEQYLINVFKKISDQYHDIAGSDNIWGKLQQLTKNTLAEFFKTIDDCEDLPLPFIDSKQNRLINEMNEEQRTVFCAIYYHGRTTSQLAVKLNKSESNIRKTLKEAFAIIRRGREHTGIY